MAVIAISRELASYGEETAQELSKLNGYKIGSISKRLFRRWE